MGDPENQDNEISERKTFSNKNHSESDIHSKRLSAILDEEVEDLHIIGFKVEIDNNPAYSFTLDRNRSKSVDILKIFANSDEVFGRRIVPAHEAESGTVRNVFEVAEVKEENLQSRVLDSMNIEKEAFGQKVVQTHQEENESIRSSFKVPTINEQTCPLSQLADIRNKRYEEGSPKVPAMELKFHSNCIENKDFEVHIKSKNDRTSPVLDNEKPCVSNNTEKQVVDVVKTDPATGAAHYVKYLIDSPAVLLKNITEVASSETQTEEEIVSSSTQTTSTEVPKSLKETVSQAIDTREISTETEEKITKSVETETEDILTKPVAVQTEKEISSVSSQTETAAIFHIEREGNASTQTEQTEDASTLTDFNICIVDRELTSEKSVDTEDLPFVPLIVAKEEKCEDKKKQATNEESCECSCKHEKHDCIYKCCFHTDCVNIIPASLLSSQISSCLASYPPNLNCDRCQCSLRSCFESSNKCDEKFKNHRHSLYCCVCAQKENAKRGVGVSPDKAEKIKSPEVINLSSMDFTPDSLIPSQKICVEPPAEVAKNLGSELKKLIKAIKVFKSLKVEKGSALQMPVIIYHVLNTFTLSKLGSCRAAVNPIDIMLSTSDDANFSKKDENSLKSKTKQWLEGDPKDKMKKPLQLISEEEKKNPSADRNILRPSSLPLDSHSEICDTRYMLDARIGKEQDSLLKDDESNVCVNGKENSKTSKKQYASMSPKIKPKAFDYTAKDVWKPRDSTSSTFFSKRMEATDIVHVGKSSSQEYFESAKSIGLNEACEAVNDHILSLRPVDEHTVRKAAELLHKRWFEVAGTKYSDVREMRSSIQYFEEFSNNLVKTLLHSVDNNGNNVLHFAFANNRFDLVDELLNNGFAKELLNKRNKSGVTPLLVCSTSQPKSQYDWSVVRKSFEAGDINAKSAKCGRTSLMNAAARGFHAMVDLLLDVGANPNLQDKDGSTALMYAAEHGQEKCVKILVRHKKCDPTIQETDGQTACSIALDNGHKNIAILIHMQALEKRRQSTNSYSNKRYMWTINNRAKKKALARVPHVDYF